MREERHNGDDFGQQTVKRALRRGVLGFGAYLLVLAAATFLPAGGLGWTRGWAFLVTFVALNAAAIFYLWHTNPEIVVARSVPHRGTQWWDWVLFSILNALTVAMFPVAAMDDARFHWSAVPLWLTVVGYLLFLIAMAGIVWVLRVNKFAEPSVRIQADRQHEVVDTGPYAVVRHPFYVAASFMYGGIPLALGSFWALIPAVLAVLALVVRTALEDRMLQDELAGYKEYAGRVRYRLIPGVW
jgi:protein-S-isoprenylcysteine O-methyltransferase Ste14